MVKHEAFFVAGLRPDLDLDVGADAGHPQGRVAQVDLHRLAGDDDRVVLRGAELDLAGLDQFAHLVVDLAAQDQRVGMFCLLAQDGFDLVEAFFVTLLIHENLGARVAN